MTKYSTHKRMIIGVASNNNNSSKKEYDADPETSGQHDSNINR